MIVIGQLPTTTSLVCSFNCSDNKRISGIYNFMTEIYKLIKYLNSRFNFKEQIPNVVKYDNVKTEKDDFL